RTPVPAVIKSLRASAQQIAKEVPATGPDSRPAAEAVLAIDGSIEGLHRLLGEEKTAAGWRSPEAAKAASRRSEIVTALTKARRLPVEIAASEEIDPLAKELHPATSTKA